MNRPARTIKILMSVMMIIAANIAPSYGQADSRPPKVLIVPPQVQDGEDMAFLKKGVVDMLGSRLARDGKVAAIPLQPDSSILPADDDAALALAKTIGADYVLMSRLTLMDNSVRTDARMLDTAHGETVLSFKRAGEQQGDVITHMDALADRINARLFGPPPDPKAAPDPAAVSRPEDRGDRADIHQHPEKLLREFGRAPEPRPGTDGLAAAQGVPLLMRSPDIPAKINGIAAGDVDGDGHAEIVCVDAMTVTVYRPAQGRFEKLTVMHAGVGNAGVDTADLNENGKDEIFVTHYDDLDGRICSYVLEWDGQQFQTVAGGLPWHFRAVDLADRGPVLLGQRRDAEAIDSDGIREMAYASGNYTGGPKVNLPGDLNSFAFAQGHVRTPAQADMVAFDADRHLQVLDLNGRQIWRGKTDYGAAPATAGPEDLPAGRDLSYLPPRVRLADLDGDALQEVITARNEGQGRDNQSGRLEIFKWQPPELAPVWRGTAIAGYISDLTLANVTGDEKPEVVAAVVRENRPPDGKTTSHLVVYPVKIPR